MKPAHFSIKKRNRILGLCILVLLVAAEFQTAQAQAWKYIAPMKQARVWHLALILNNGKILAMGGQDGSSALNSCELYDPSTNVWTNVASMNTPRWCFQACLLPDGKVFVAGGRTDLGNSTTSTCEIYDPVTNIWSFTASMSEGREEFGLCIIPGNKIALIGGLDGNTSQVVATGDVFDIATETMTPLPNQLQIECAVTAVYSPISNSIYVPGGNQGGYGSWKLQMTQKFSLDDWQWSTVDSIIDRQGAQFNTLTRPTTGEIFLFTNDTGYNLKITTLVESMDPSTGVWQSKGTFTPCSDPRGVIVDDSAVFPGGESSSGNAISNCSWFNFASGVSTEGPPLLEPIMHNIVLYAGASESSTPCPETRKLYVIGGQNGSSQIVADCEVLDLGTIPSLLFVPKTSKLNQSSCIAVDSTVPIDIDGCTSNAPSLDSLWLTGSSNFTISDSRAMPRTLAAFDSILVSYLGTRGPDTALLHLQYNLGSGLQDTTIQLIGTVTWPFVTQPAQIHREAASAYFGQIDSLTLGVDLASQINIDSLWPYITDISFTYTWDSSVVSYYSYLAPSGWGISSISHSGNSASIDIQNNASSVTQPLDLGIALFHPRSTLLATSWVELPSLVIDVGGQSLSLCVTDNEDNHWAVKTLGIQSGVAEVPIPSQDISIYPNPATDELFVQNANRFSLSIEIYDAIGREVVSATGGPAATTTIATQSLQDGVYFLRITNGAGFSASSKLTIVR